MPGISDLCSHHFFLTAFRLRPPAIEVWTGALLLVTRVLRLFGVTVPLPGASDAVPDALSPSSRSSSGSTGFSLAAGAPPRTLAYRPDASTQGQVLRHDGGIAVELSTGRRLPSASS